MRLFGEKVKDGFGTVPRESVEGGDELGSQRKGREESGEIEEVMLGFVDLVS